MARRELSVILPLAYWVEVRSVEVRVDGSGEESGRDREIPQLGALLHE